jgi:hypothetical protein
MAVAAHLVGTLINIGLKVVPIPYLDTSFSILTTLYTSIQHVRGIKAQMIALATSIEQLLCHLNVELHGMDHLDKSIEILLEDFTRFVVNHRLLSRCTPLTCQIDPVFFSKFPKPLRSTASKATSRLPSCRQMVRKSSINTS